MTCAFFFIRLEQRIRTHTTDNTMLRQIPTREPCDVIFHSARTKNQNTHHRQRNAQSDTHQGALWCHIPLSYNKEPEHTPQTMQCSVRYPPGSLVRYPQGSLVRYPPGSLVVSYSTQLEQRIRTHTTDNTMLCQIPTREPCGVIFHSARTKNQNTHHRQHNALSDSHQGAL